MTTLLAFVFVLGVLVFFHEAGHFLSAKWLKVKVNVFSLGFPPKLVGRKWGDTEYQIGLLPIGGYVKMAGDNPLEATGNPEEFMSRSKLERLVILFMGPMMNLILAVLIFTGLFMVGISQLSGLEDPPVIRFVSPDSPAGNAGVEPGDRIVAINDQEIVNWRQTLDIFLVSANETLLLSLEREGELIKVPLEVAQGEEESGYTGLFPAMQPQVAALREDFPAAHAGVAVGDIIAKLDGVPIYTNRDLINAIERKDGQAVWLGLMRDGTSLELELTPRRDQDRWLIGIEFPSPLIERQIQNPVLALGAAVQECTRFTSLTFTVIGRMITGRASVRQMSGPIGIARISGETARRGIKELFTLMALLSLNLGILNLLPIPLLDGGHMTIILLEGLAGRDFSLRVKERILQVGFIMLLLLMLTVIYVDLSKIESIARYLPW